MEYTKKQLKQFIRELKLSYEDAETGKVKRFNLRGLKRRELEDIIDSKLLREQFMEWLPHPIEKVEAVELSKAPKGYHYCKYCGKLTKGTDEDLLCEECHELFGHSHFSEL